MAALPYMQLYVAEYLADTSHLNAAQHGAYLLLLMNYWQRGKALPDMNNRLAIVARMSSEEWTTNREVVSEFFQISDGVWIHDRVERDLQKVKGVSEAGRIAGLASGKARKERASNGRSTEVDNLFNETQTKDEPLRTDTDQNRSKQNKESVFVLPEWIPENLWNDFVKNRKTAKKPLSEHAKDLAVRKLDKFKAEGYDVTMLLEETVLRGWQSFFVNENTPKAPKPKREIHVLTQRELDEQNYRDFGSPPPEEWAPADAPQGWVPCHN